MNNNLSRRNFIKGAASTAVASAVLIGTSKTSWAGANDRVRVAVLGINGRGKDHLKGYLSQRDVEVVTLCDIDTNLFKPRVEEFFSRKKVKEPKCEQDLRRVMDDKDIDVISIATPNHWHSLAGIWACQAGKHAYVEKPCSQNYFDGRQLAAAAKKYGTVVQHGTQIRSNPSIQEAMAHLHNGAIGEVYMARGLCYKTRGDIGKKPDSDVPKGVDYDIWLGPAPVRPFNENRFHYNWHWHWDYGNGDLGNQGVHQLDVCRWGLGVELPTRITAMGGLYLWDDAKEVPNVMTTAYDYPDAGKKGKMLTFEVRPWATNEEGKAKIGCLFYGSTGYMVIDSYSRYQIYDIKDQPGANNSKEADHYENFIEAVRANDPGKVNAPIVEGHKSSALAHFGLISARVKRSLTWDNTTETFTGDAEATALLTRNYRAPFVVPEKF